MFFNRIFNVLDALYDMDNQISEKEYFEFCMETGYPMQHDIIVGECWDIVIDILRSNSDTIKEFLPYYMYFINCQEDKEYKPWTRERFKQLICNCLKDTHIPFDVLEENGAYFIFPKGAKELDDTLVSEPLEWLKEYPQAHKTYCIALKQYSDGIYIRDVADNLRKALEDFLREFLGNNNDFNKNKKEVESYLKSQNADSHLITLLCSLLNHYYLLNNEVAKHNDKMDEKYLEFLLYQTGIFLRTLIIVKREENNE